MCSEAACQPWVALVAFAIIAYFAFRNIVWIRSLPRSEGEDAATGFLGSRARVWYRECTRPFEDVFVAAGISPDLLTYAQGVLAAAAGLCFAVGWMFLGGWLVIGAGTLDVMDGGLARRQSGGTPRGAFVDSVMDRYSELFTFAGLAVYFRASWVIWIVGLGLFGSLMVSYTRARAQGLGVDCRIGASQRAERVVLVGFGAFLSDIVGHLWYAWTGSFSHALLSMILVALAIVANVTALRRIRWITGRLDGSC